jgi:hypothetical protein
MAIAPPLTDALHATARRGVVALARVAAVLGLLALAACGGIVIKPEPVLPRALVVAMPARVGLVLPAETRKYVHSESRWGVDWKVDLGSGHEKLAPRLFQTEFSDVQVFDSVDAARRARDLKAIFELRIENYSFNTQRETGRYYAVTIRYRLNLYAPDGNLADSYTFTGYGTSLAGSMASEKPLAAATLAAMRDAAAKFLVQFPDQPAGRTLAKNEPVVAEALAAGGAGGSGVGRVRDIIEPVPIEESDAAGAAIAPSQPPASPPVPAAAPASAASPAASASPARQPWRAELLPDGTR